MVRKYIEVCDYCGITYIEVEYKSPFRDECPECGKPEAIKQRENRVLSGIEKAIKKHQEESEVR